MAANLGSLWLSYHALVLQKNASLASLALFVALAWFKWMFFSSRAITTEATELGIGLTTPSFSFFGTDAVKTRIGGGDGKMFLVFMFRRGKFKHGQRCEVHAIVGVLNDKLTGCVLVRC